MKSVPKILKRISKTLTAVVGILAKIKRLFLPLYPLPPFDVEITVIPNPTTVLQQSGGVLEVDISNIVQQVPPPVVDVIGPPELEVEVSTTPTFQVFFTLASQPVTIISNVVQTSVATQIVDTLDVDIDPNNPEGTITP